MKNWELPALVLSLIILLISCTDHHGPNTDWTAYGGNKAGNRYSSLSQINRSSIARLKLAWVYHSSDTGATGKRGSKRGPELDIQCQPIVVHGLLYGTDPRLKLFAADAATGEPRWTFDPFADGSPRYTKCRGLTWWESGDDQRIFYAAGSFLYCINAKTGKPVEAFGDSGKLNLHTGLDINHDVKELYVATTTPGIIYKNIIIIGSAVSEAGNAAPGYVRGFDVLTGRLIWTFHTIPQPGEPGYDSWPKEAYRWAGGANNWGGLSLDEKRGAVYFGTGSPASDFYGGDRAGMNLFGNCVIALNAENGQLKWYYQTTHHDLWDSDIPCAPNLVTIQRDGKAIDVLVQVTKDGRVFVLDRENGQPIFPVEEKPVSTAGLPGEHPWPVQPIPSKPLPLCDPFFSDSTISKLFPGSFGQISEAVRGMSYGSKFIPPSVNGTVQIGYSGGAEWGGNAVDSNGIFYQNSNNAPWVLKMISRADLQKEIAALSHGNGLYVTNCSPCHGADRRGNGLEIPSLLNISTRLKEDEILRIVRTGQGRMPSFQTMPEEDRLAIVRFLENARPGFFRNAPEHADTSRRITGGLSAKSQRRTAKENVLSTESSFPYNPPYLSKAWDKLTDSAGYPGIRPPWGTLSAIDLNTGEYRWQVPLGEYPELAKKGVPATGTESYGGPLVTAGGLLFIAGTRDEKIRAFDTQTGKVVWEYQLPAGGFASPITYQIDGKQYIVIAAGGGRGLKTGGDYIAFALTN